MLHDALRESALANFELLLDHWKLTYRKISGDEYDIIATWRSDGDFGACRFNLKKGRGADFAGSFLSDDDYTTLGNGFSKEDFSGYSSGGQAKIGFDIIGLCQRIYRLDSYSEGARWLRDDIQHITTSPDFIKAAADAAERRRKEQEEQTARRIQQANDVWKICEKYPLKGSVGELYLNKRGITKLDKNIRFHPNIQYGLLRVNFPALIFKVQAKPDGPLMAIHRIFLDRDGTKAKVDNAKMALAPIKGGGIWFGDTCDTLYVVEGPENALTVLEMGGSFVWSSVFASNMPNLDIPSNVNRLIVASDPDRAGEEAYIKLKERLTPLIKAGLKVTRLDVPRIKKKDGKYADLNDIWVGV